MCGVHFHFKVKSWWISLPKWSSYGNSNDCIYKHWFNVPEEHSSITIRLKRRCQRNASNDVISNRFPCKVEYNILSERQNCYKRGLKTSLACFNQAFNSVLFKFQSSTSFWYTWGSGRVRSVRAPKSTRISTRSGSTSPIQVSIFSVITRFLEKKVKYSYYNLVSFLSKSWN